MPMSSDRGKTGSTGVFLLIVGAQSAPVENTSADIFAYLFIVRHNGQLISHITYWYQFWELEEADGAF